MINEKEILSTMEKEDSTFDLISSYLGIFGHITLTNSGTYYVYTHDFKGFLKAKHLIFVVQELNKLNKYDEYKNKIKRM